MKMRKLASMILATTMILGVLASCSSAPNEGEAGEASNAEGSESNVLTVALASEPVSLDPQNSNDTISIIAQRQIFDSLLHQDETMELNPAVAESWEMIDDTTIRFTLRDDVYFHNGEKMTASDVVFSFKRGAASSFRGAQLSAFDTENFVVVDDTTLDVKLKFPYTTAMSYMASISTSIVPEKAVTEMGDDAFGRSPIGTGPYKFEEWVQGDRLILSANTDYFKGEPGTDELHIRFITESASRTIELETGGVDVVLDVPVNDIAKLEENPEINVLTAPGVSLVYIGFNTQKAPYDDVKVRQALYYAIDRESILQTVFNGIGEVADGPFSSTVFSYAEPETPYEYDPERSKELLAEAGYSDGLDIIVGTDENSIRRDIAEMVQFMWAEVGVNAEIKSYEFAALNEVIANDEHDLFVFSTIATLGDPDHAMYTPFYSTAANNRANYVNPETDALLDIGRTTFDLEERAGYYVEFQEIIREDLPWMPIQFGEVIWACSADVENLNVHSGNMPDFYTATLK